jgi:hypothetical protein
MESLRERVSRTSEKFDRAKRKGEELAFADVAESLGIDKPSEEDNIYKQVYGVIKVGVLGKAAEILSHKSKE